MERSRFRAWLGIGLIVLGVIFLSQALAQPMLTPLQALPPLPPLPALPPLTSLPPHAPQALPFLHHGGWISPPLLLLGLVALALMWRRRGACVAGR